MDYYVMAAAGAVLMLGAWIRAMKDLYGPKFFMCTNKQGEQ